MDFDKTLFTSETPWQILTGNDVATPERGSNAWNRVPFCQNEDEDLLRHCHQPASEICLENMQTHAALLRNEETAEKDTHNEKEEVEKTCVISISCTLLNKHKTIICKSCPTTDYTIIYTVTVRYILGYTTQPSSSALSALCVCSVFLAESVQLWHRHIPDNIQ